MKQQKKIRRVNDGIPVHCTDTKEWYEELFDKSVCRRQAAAAEKYVFMHCL